MKPPPTQKQLDSMALSVVKMGRGASVHIVILGTITLVYAVVWFFQHGTDAAWWATALWVLSLLIATYYILDAFRVEAALSVLERHVKGEQAKR